MKAYTYVDVSDNPMVSAETVRDVSFITVADLVTALLTEVQNIYVTKNDYRDQRMRRHIAKTIDIINSHEEIANLIIKNNPFHTKKPK